MSDSWKARKMVPGKDTISTMALHYGTTPATLREVIKQAGVEVIREDGFKGALATVKSVSHKSRVIGWSDGVPGVDSSTTKLTRAAISAVVQWKIEQSETTAAA